MPNVIAGPKVWFVPTNDRPRHAKADVGARLRAVRAALGVHQKVMAQALNVSPQAWSGWENGRDLADPLVMARAALRYGFTTDWIFLGRLTLLPGELADELARRRPDLILGASPDAEPAADWDALAAPKRQAG